MNLPDIVRTYLDRQQLPYRLIPYRSNETPGQAAERLDIPVRRVVRTALLKDAAWPIMALKPAPWQVISGARRPGTCIAKAVWSGCFWRRRLTERWAR